MYNLSSTFDEGMLFHSTFLCDFFVFSISLVSETTNYGQTLSFDFYLKRKRNKNEGPQLLGQTAPSTCGTYNRIQVQLLYGSMLKICTESTKVFVFVSFQDVHCFSSALSVFTSFRAVQLMCSAWQLRM